MTGDSLASLVSWIPTLIVLLIVAINIVIGLWRGFRKSTILLIHYIISTAIGIIVFFTATSLTYSDK